MEEPNSGCINKREPSIDHIEQSHLLEDGGCEISWSWNVSLNNESRNQDMDDKDPAMGVIRRKFYRGCCMS